MSVSWQDQYTAALRDYVARSDEAGLEQAYELGRQMVGDERAMLDLVEVYHRELAALVRAAPTPDDCDRTTALARAFFSESLSPFAMAQRVTICVAPQDVDYFRLEVEDSGIGIPPQDMARLFVEFQQLDAGASKKYQGTGLGLALTRRIVEAQGGRVGVRSTPGEGSTFFAVLPRVATRAPADVAGPGDLPRARNAGRRTILVVEDDRNIPGASARHGPG